MSQGEKKEKILHVAEKMFATRRFHEVTLDQIATAAHVGKGTIYLYFESKDDLLFQLVTGILNELEHRLNLVAASEKPLREKLYSFIDEMGTFFRSHHVALHQFHNPQLERTKPEAGKFMRAHHDRITDLARKIIREGFEEGLIAPRVDLEAATCMFISTVHGHDMWFIDTGKEIPVQVLIDLFMNGVGTPAGKR
jgi:AcrR family transcriptional regulator